MVLIKEIELQLTQKSNLPEAIEDTLIKDSVIDLASGDFSTVDVIEDVGLGEIRKKIVVDSGYSGKPVSRKKYSSSTLIGDKYAKREIGIDGREEECSDVSESGIDRFNETNSSAYELSESDIEGSTEDRQSEVQTESEEDTDNEEDDNTDSDLGDDIDLSQDQEELNEEQKQDINIFSAAAKDTDTEVAKGISVKNQLSIWESLVEGRIKLQTAIIAANKLYQKEHFTEFKKKLAPEDESVLSDTYSSLENLMRTLLELQEVLINCSPEYLNNETCNTVGKNMDENREVESDDESISSSLASGNEEKEVEDIKLNYKEINSELDEPKYEPNKKKLKLDNHSSDHLQELYLSFKPFKDTTIQFWNEKTRITSGKISSSDFSAFDQPTLKQIEQILLDKNRLIRKTQLKRTDYKVLGKQPQVNMQDEDVEFKGNERNQKEYDPEIFDDDDFYHKLLRDFIERKSTDVTDANKLGRRWLEIQQLRSKMKRKVDTRCTKGRKLRYTVHNKLVNFMAPIPCNTWSNQASTQLFKSLFSQSNPETH